MYAQQGSLDTTRSATILGPSRRLESNDTRGRASHKLHNISTLKVQAALRSYAHGLNETLCLLTNTFDAASQSFVPSMCPLLWVMTQLQFDEANCSHAKQTSLDLRLTTTPTPDVGEIWVVVGKNFANNHRLTH